jgi:hypothetical protein
MVKALAEVLTLILMVFYIFQPVYLEFHHQRVYAVERILNDVLIKASTGQYGNLTDELRNELIARLKDIRIDEKSIRVNGEPAVRTGNSSNWSSQNPLPRGEEITITLEIESTPVWMYRSLFGKEMKNGCNQGGSNCIRRTVSMMSEYIESN